MESLKKLLENQNWKNFESFIAEIFERFNYKVERNVRIKFLRNKEFDLIAKKSNVLILVECKRWKKEYSKYKNAKKEIKKFKEKIEAYSKFQAFKKVYGILIFLNTTFQPIKDDNVFVISLDYLNQLLLDLESFYIF